MRHYELVTVRYNNVRIGREWSERAQGGRYRGRSARARRKNEKGLRRETQALEFFGGRYWDRTSDPCRVKAVLYR